MMEGFAFLPLPQGLRITEVCQEERCLLVKVLSVQKSACCPLCSQESDTVHSRYQRRLKDLPSVGQAVYLHLTVRKFFCWNPECQRKIFTERLPAFVEPWAQATVRFVQALQAIGLATSGSLGTRLAARLGIATSWMTIIRRIMDIVTPAPSTVTTLGIDDFSFQRGRKFGTILVDLSSHQVIDLLPERAIESTAAWMQSHPEIRYVSRDRGHEYAQAACKGAPQAIQCADRFHLMKNLVEAVEPVVTRCYKEIKKKDVIPFPRSQASKGKEWRPTPDPANELQRRSRLAKNQERFEQMITFQKLGFSPDEIAQRLGVTTRTLLNWRKQGVCPGTKQRRKRRSLFDPYAPYILKRWKEGCKQGSQLYHEIKEQGYTGTDKTMYRFLKTLKQESVELPQLPILSRISVQEMIWLVVRSFDELEESERMDLTELCLASQELATLHPLIQSFGQIMRKLEGARLEDWKRQVEASNIPEIHRFSKGLERDKEAVLAGLTLKHSNGQVEGQVNKLKRLV